MGGGSFINYIIFKVTCVVLCVICIIWRMFTGREIIWGKKFKNVLYLENFKVLELVSLE